MAMWECDELNDTNYEIINKMLLRSSYGVPIVLYLIGFIWVLITETKKLDGFLWFVSCTIETLYSVIWTYIFIYGILLQASRKQKSKK